MPQPRTSAPTANDFTPTVIIPHAGFLEPRILEPLSNPNLHDFLERILGKNFYLSHTWFQKVPPGTGRLSFHKDRRGSINFNILVDDVDEKMGSTCLIPGSHNNTPPVEYYMNDPRRQHPNEVDMTGKAGDMVFFSSEAWHARSQNNSKHSTRRLFYNFFSRSSRDTTAWNGVVSDAQLAAAKAVIPSEYHHMFSVNQQEAQRLATVQGSRLKRWALESQNSGEFFRDLAYSSLVCGRSANNDHHDGYLRPYTSRLVEETRFSALRFFLHVRPVPTLKVVAKKLLQRKAAPKSMAE